MKKRISVFLLFALVLPLLSIKPAYSADDTIWRLNFDDAAAFTPGEEPKGWYVDKFSGEGSGFVVTENGKNGNGVELLCNDNQGKATCREFVQMAAPTSYEFTMNFMIAKDSDHVMQLNLTNAAGHQGPCLNFKPTNISCDQEQFFNEGKASSRAVSKNFDPKKGTWQTLKLVLHMDTQTYDIYLNNAMVLTDVYFRKKTATVIEKFEIVSGGSNTEVGLRHMYFDSMKVAIPEVSIFGYDTAEDFEDTEVGDRPFGFEDMSGGFTGGGYFVAAADGNQQVAEFYATEGTAGNRIKVALAKEYKEISTFEFDYMIKSDLGMQLNLLNPGGQAFLCMNLSTAKFDISQEETDPAQPSLVFAQNLSKDRWYHIRVESDAQNQLMDIYLDGKLVAPGAKPRKRAASSIKEITIVSGGGSAAVGERRCWIDNVYFYEGVRPAVETSSIADGESGVNISTDTLKLSFNCAMRDASAEGSPVALVNAETGEQLDVSCTADGQDYTVTWPAPLDYAATYEVSLTDWAQSEYRIPSEAYRIAFTTEANPEDHPGSVAFRDVRDGDLFLEGTEVTIAVNANDEDGIRTITLLVNGEAVRESHTAPYSISYRALSGRQTLRLLMTDRAGTRTYSEQITVTGGKFAVSRPAVSRADGVFRAETVAQNRSAQAESVTLILATYESGGELAAIDLKEITLQPGQSETIRIEGLAGGAQATAYVCGAFCGLVPYLVQETLR